MPNDLDIIAECLRERGVNVKMNTVTAITIEVEPPSDGYAAVDFDIIMEDMKIYICRYHAMDLHHPDSLDNVAKIIKHCSKGPGIIPYGSSGKRQEKHCEKCRTI
jgi:hypothetical protein